MGTSTGVEPVIAGKPQPLMLEVARERVGGTPALMIGDRIDTDVIAAQAVGWPSALVLTGATGVPELAVAPAWPDFLLRGLADVLVDLPHPQIRAASGPDLPAIAQLLHDGGLQAGAARERLGRTIVAEVDRKVIATAPLARIDYLELVNAESLQPIESIQPNSLVAVAVFFGQTRLIDNIRLP